MGFNYVTMTLHTNQLGFIWYSNKCVNSKSHAYLSNYKRFSVRRNLHFRPFFTTIRHWDKILSAKDTEKDLYLYTNYLFNKFRWCGKTCFSPKLLRKFLQIFCSSYFETCLFSHKESVFDLTKQDISWFTSCNSLEG